MYNTVYMRYFVVCILCALSLSAFAASPSYYEEALQSYEDKKFELSIKYLEKNIVFNPKSSVSYILLGKSYAALENREKANKYYRIAYSLVPENIELNYLLGESSFHLDLIEEYGEYLSNLEILCSGQCDEIDKLKKLSIE